MPVNDHDVCILKLQDSTANARSAFFFPIVSFYSNGRKKKKPRQFLKQAYSGWHAAQEGIFYTNFRAEMADGGGGRELPRQGLGLGKSLKSAPCVTEASRDPCGF